MNRYIQTIRLFWSTAFASQLEYQLNFLIELLAMLGTLLGSVFILQGFEEIMIKSELRSLFFYTPLIAAMAGNVGVQSSAIIVQGIANQVIKGSLIKRLFKAKTKTKQR